MRIFMPFSLSFISHTALTIFCSLALNNVATAQPDSDGNQHHNKHHQQQNNAQSSEHDSSTGQKHGGGHSAGGHSAGGHAGGGHGGGHGHHGMVHKDAKKFPSTSYSETKHARAISRPTMPGIKGDAAKGKQLAYAKSKGRCLACHIMGADAAQAGDVGLNLSRYGTLGRDDNYIFQQVWDARAHNPNTLMPPFGTHGILNKHEVMHIVAYLKTLKHEVAAPQRPQLQARNFLVAKDDFTGADEYVEKGAKLFAKPAKSGKACASCHNDKASAGNLQGVAATYPKYLPAVKKIINIEDRINLCRKSAMNAHPYKLGSKHLNMLSSYVKYLSRNTPINVATDGPAASAIQRGKGAFFAKAGQLNFSCADCHTTAANKWLRGQPLSSIKTGGKHSYTASTWPKHFIAGHDLGLISLQQRIHHCQAVTRTVPLKLGSPEYTEMELYLTTLANGTPMLAPTKSKLRGQD